MTFTIQPWPDNVLDQQDFIRDLRAGLNEAEQVCLSPTVVKATEPTDSEFLAAWQTQFDAPSIPLNGRIQWFNPNTALIENVYTKINDLGAGMSTGALHELLSKARVPGLVFLGSDRALTNGVASLSVTGISQAYKDLLILTNLRSTVAAVSSNQNVRINGLATAYYFEHRRTTQAADNGVEGINQAGLTQVCPAASTPSMQYNSGMIICRDYANASKINYGHCHHTELINASSSGWEAKWGHWLQNSAAAITDVSVVPVTATSIAIDSYLAVFGIV